MPPGVPAATIAAMTQLTITLHGASGAQGAPLSLDGVPCGSTDLADWARRQE